MLMMQDDNWGSLARFGMFIVGSEAVPEAEWWAMMPPKVSVHACRVTARAPWAAWNDDRSAVEPAADVERGLGQFASMRLDAVVVGHSSSSFLGGIGWDEAIVARLAERLPASVHVTTNGLDCQAALRASGIQRPLLVLPAWFGPTTAAAGVAYFSDRGIQPIATLSYDPGSKWRSVPPDEMYPKGLGFEQEIEPLRRQIISACPTAADGVLIAGTGFRCIGIIDALESALKRPVITANQASLWHCLRRASITTTVTGYGRLLADR